MSWMPRIGPAGSRRMRIADRSSRAKRRGPFPDNRDPDTRGIARGASACWCGEPHGHDWEGKADGAAHPRG
jgi:hypothetical protein